MTRGHHTSETAGLTFDLKIHQSPPESTYNRRETIIRLLDFPNEQLVSTRQPRLIPSGLANYRMLPCAQYTLGIRIRETSLVVGMFAHEVYSGQIELLRAGCAPSDLEYLRLDWIGQRSQLCGFLGSLGSIGLDEGSILDGKPVCGR
jgi:hypothetical protein